MMALFHHDTKSLRKEMDDLRHKQLANMFEDSEMTES